MPLSDGRAFVMENRGSLLAFPYKETNHEIFHHQDSTNARDTALQHNPAYLARKPTSPGITKKQGHDPGSEIYFVNGVPGPPLQRSPAETIPSPIRRPR